MLRKIVDKQIEIVKSRLQKQKINLDISKKAKDFLAESGYDPSFGARPLKRTIQNEILDELALRIIEGKIKEGTPIPKFDDDKAGAGYGSKIERGSRMLGDYEIGKIVHVRGTHAVLERSLRRFPNKPLDLADGAFWSWNDLRGRPKAKVYVPGRGHI